MAGIFATLIDYMESEQWKYEILEGDTMLRFHVKTSAGIMICYADVNEAHDWLCFYSILPVNVTPDRRAAMAEFLSRANHGLRIGNFEMDFDEGEVRFKTSIDIEGGELTETMIDNLLRANLSTMNMYFHGLMKTIFSEKSPSEIIASIERPSKDVITHHEEEEVDFTDDDEDSDDGEEMCNG